MNMVNVTVNGRVVTVEQGTSLARLLPEGRAHVDMPCGGHGTCGKCRVTVAGEVSPPTDTEKRWLTPAELSQGVRLSCLTFVLGDCTVTTGEPMDNEKQIVTDGEMPNVILRPAFSSYGVAVDLGTTTLAARLYDRAGNRLAEVGRPNPQAAWGADVISRIEAAMGGANEAIASAVCAAIDEMLTALAADGGMSTCDIDGLTVTGNTAMLHLLTNTSPEPLSHAPFAAKRLFGEELTAGTLGLSVLSPEARIYLPPCISAFVGADTVTALLASDLCGSDTTQMLVDIGTNGEMALWHGGKLYACSTAAGPAFEGAGISMGMAGGEGAVDHVVLCNGHLLAHVIGNVPPRGICGSGLVDAVACLLDNETLDETGYLDDDPVAVAPPVVLTQGDIRAVQLAKSAIHAGIRTLLGTAAPGGANIERLVIAGGFGSYLDVKNAGRIGLLPKELMPRIRAVGNAALAGASMLLLDRELRTEAARLAELALPVELATNPLFVEAYMEGMYF